MPRREPDTEGPPDLTPEARAVFDVMRRQRATRVLRPDPVPSAWIDWILESATHAPSARNRQPWHFVVVEDAGQRGRIADAAQRAWQAGAREASRGEPMFDEVDRWVTSGLAVSPVIVVVCGDRTRTSDAEMASSIYPAVQNVLLGAGALGLASLMSTLPIFARAPSLNDVLELPSSLVPMAVVPLGFPAKPPGRPRREPLAEHASRDRHGGPWERDSS